MIADILMYISVICVFASLVPACISDYKTRTVDPKLWRYAAYFGIPIGIIAFILKLLSNEIILPSLILSIASVLIVILITVAAAHIRDPFYNPSRCKECNHLLNTKKDLFNCPNCNYENAKSILGGADMIAIDIILLTSFYISQLFIITFAFSFSIASAILILILVLKTKDFKNYRLPLIIPITIGYSMTLIISFLSINIVKFLPHL
jgi:hypothetical protein